MKIIFINLFLFLGCDQYKTHKPIKLNNYCKEVYKLHIKRKKNNWKSNSHYNPCLDFLKLDHCPCYKYFKNKGLI